MSFAGPILGFLERRPRLSRRDVVLTLVPAILWALIVLYARPALTRYTCIQKPEVCQVEALHWPDRLAVPLDFHAAAKASDIGQNSSGALALGFPLLVHGARMVTGVLSPAAGLIQIATNTVVVLQVTLWNGLFLDVTRLIVQRPRPFVYRNPQKDGDNAVHYTSFYSGHTSFTSAAVVTFIITLLSLGISKVWFFVLGGMASTLPFITGLGRVLSAKHFFTDVVFSIFAGTAVALVLAYIHRRGRV